MMHLFVKQRIIEQQYAPCYSKKGLNILRRIVKPINGLETDLNGRRFPL